MARVHKLYNKRDSKKGEYEGEKEVLEEGSRVSYWLAQEPTATWCQT